MQEGATAQIHTVKEPADVEYTVKRSHFFGSIRTISSHEEFEIQLRSIEELYPKANHYAWAYRLHGSTVLEHSNDNGEPSGSAGRPILGALKRHDLTDTMIVVTRYFGGIKLGIPGLISAYGTTADEAAKAADIIVKEDMYAIRYVLPYDIYDRYLYIFTSNNISKDRLCNTYTNDIEGTLVLSRTEKNVIYQTFINFAHEHPDLIYDIKKI